MSVKIHIQPDYAALTPFVRDLANKGVPADAQCIYAGRNHLYRIEREGIELNIKAFRRPSFPNCYIYTTARASKARRSCQYAAQLLHRGISTPAPVAWIEVKKNGKLTESYYVSLQSPSERNLRDWQSWPEAERDEILTAYARFMLRLHNAGIQHHDLSPGNVLWRRDPASGQVLFEIVDLNRMTIHNRPLTEDEAFTNFRNINLDPAECARLGRLYGTTRGMNPDTAADKAVTALRADQRRKQRLHRLKDIIK